MITAYENYRKSLSQETKRLRSTAGVNPLDKEAQAQLGLLVAVSEYESAIFGTKVANKRWEGDQSEENAQTVRETVDKRSLMGLQLKEAIRNINLLEGKKPYAEREVLGVRWKPTKGNLPHRY